MKSCKKNYLCAWICRSFSDRLKVSLAWYLAIPFHFPEFCRIMWFRISGICTRVRDEHTREALLCTCRCAEWACTCSKVSPVFGGAGSVMARWARKRCRSWRMGSWSISTSVRNPRSWSTEGQWHLNARLWGEKGAAEDAIGLSDFIINGTGRGWEKYNRRKHHRKNNHWKQSLCL